MRCAVRPAVSLAGFAVAVLAAALLGACGSDGDGGPVAPLGSAPGLDTSTSVTSPASVVATSPTQPPPTVARPGPPGVGQCGVVVDDTAPPAGGTVAATVLSGVPGSTFLARVVAGSTASTESGAVDGSGSGTVRLSLPASPPGQPVQVEISVAGGIETCSTTITPR